MLGPCNPKCAGAYWASAGSISTMGPVCVRCPLLARNVHSRMPLNFTPLLRLKYCHACDQWHSSRVFTPLL
jgi:hypothetical protein